jgi:ankyrin repeat protein
MDEYGRTALFYTAYYGNLEAIELLAAADASFNITDSRHRTALHYACLNDNSKLIELIFMAFKT